MSLNIRVESTFPGYGVGVRNDSVYYQAGIALSTTGQGTSPIPATGTILGTTRGKIHIKIYNGGGTSPTLTDLLVNATDGTNTVAVFEYHPTVACTLTTTHWFERIFDYLLDQVTGSTGSGGAAGQLINGGAVTFNVLTTLGGTTPTASMDLEIVPLV